MEVVNSHKYDKALPKKKSARLYLVSKPNFSLDILHRNTKLVATF